MKRKMRNARRMIVVVLGATLFVTSSGIEALGEVIRDGSWCVVSDTVLQADLDNDEPEIVRELEEERTENSNTYLLDNGMKQTVYYSDAIRYEDEEGKLVDYDPELTITDEEGYLYENTAGDSRQYIPNRLDTSTPILMTHKDYRMSFTPVAVGEELTRVTTDSMTIEDSYENETESEVLASYSAQKAGITYEYQSLQYGVKENIILDEIPENNIFAFRLKMKGMTARLDSYGGGITFMDEETEDITGGMDAPFMNDATGEAYSEDVHYKLVEIKKGEENIYLLFVIADREYLESEDRVYPVTIDPSATWTGNTNLSDVYIINGGYGDTNFYSSGVMTLSVGKGSQGTFRSLIRAKDLYGTIGGKYVESAKLTLYECGDYNSGVEIQVRNLSESFSMADVTWNTRPACTSVKYATVNSRGTGGSADVFNITTWARGVANGSIKNRGLMLKTTSETDGSYCKFYGARTSTTSKRPKLEVIYYDGPTQPTGVSIEKRYLKSGENLKISWTGIVSKALDYVNYRVYKYDDEAGKLGDIYVDYSASTKIGTASSGTKTITASSGWPEGHYVIYVKGVDKGGISGKSRGVHFYIDRSAPKIITATTSPVTSSSSYGTSLPTIIWNVEDSWFKCLYVSINGGEYALLSESFAGSITLTGLKNESANTIRLKALDNAGNYSSIKTLTYHYDSTSPVITSMKLAPATNSTAYSSNISPLLTYETAEANIKEVAYKVGSGSWYTATATGSGSIRIPSAIINNNAGNSVYFRITDKAGNTATKSLVYYCDNVAPVLGNITVLPVTNGGSASTSKPEVIWSGITESHIKEVQYSINGSPYASMGNAASGSAMLPEAAFSTGGTYYIRIRAVDRAGNVSATYSTAYYYKSPDESVVEKYRPEGLKAVEKLDGTTLIEFVNGEGKVPDNVSYEVYRAEQPLFVPSDETLMCDGLGEFLTNIEGNPSTQYYYKVRAVMHDRYGNITAYGSFSDEITSVTAARNEGEKRTGRKEIYDYMEYATPLGTGAVELSEGNLMYAQTDAVLGAAGTGIVVTRTYNSMTSLSGMFGAGQTVMMDESLTVCSEEDLIIYRYSDGSTYTCSLNGEGAYTPGADNGFEIWESDYTFTDYDGQTTENAAYEVRYDSGIKKYFDYAGRLFLTADEDGSWTYVHRDSMTGRVDEVATDKGEKAQFEWISMENGICAVAGMSLTNGRRYTYTYDTRGHMTSVTAGGIPVSEEEHIEISSGYITNTYTYGSNGKLCMVTDALGNEYSIEYSSGKAVSVTYPDGHRYRVEYGDNSAQVIREAPGGKILGSSSYVFDGYGKAQEITDESGNTTSYTYSGDSITSETRDVTYTVMTDGVITEAAGELREDIQYDERGRVTSYRDGSGGMVICTYTVEDVVYSNSPVRREIRDSLGNLVSITEYGYSSSGNLIREDISSYAGADITERVVREYIYDDDEYDSDPGTLDRVTETVMGTSENTEGAVSSVTDIKHNEDGTVAETGVQSGTVDQGSVGSYNSYGLVTEETDEKGNRREYWYDGAGRVTRQTETSVAGKVTTVITVYNDNGSIIQTTDTVGRTAEYTYDSCNRVTGERITAGNSVRNTTTTYGYESVSIHNGSGTDIIYEGAYTVTKYNTQGETESRTYTDGQGRTIRELKNGIFCDYTYDSRGNVYTTYMGGTDEGDTTGGRLEAYTYDKNGNATATLINPVYRDGTYTVGEDTMVTSAEYDENGRVIKKTDGRGNSVSYAYDSQGRITEVYLSDSTGTWKGAAYEYGIQKTDEQGNLLSVSDRVTDALGRVSVTTSNTAGQLLEIQDVAATGNISVSYEYDASGNKVKEIYTDGSYVSYIYDALNILIRKEEHAGDGAVTGASEYEYDTEYNTVCIRDMDETDTPYHYTFYTYDEFGRVSGCSEINATTVTEEDREAHLVSYGYDEYDRLSEIRYPDDGSRIRGIRISYNVHNWVTGICAVKVDGATEETVKVRDYTYHGDGRVKEIRDYSGFLENDNTYISRRYEYDVFDRVTLMYYTVSTSPGVVYESHEYTYDMNSNITSERDFADYGTGQITDRTRKHTYDELNRLVSTEETDNLTGNGTQSSYRYDRAGNRIEAIEDGTRTEYTFNELDQMVRADMSGRKTGYKTYGYDMRGNLITEYDSITDTYTINEYSIQGCLTRTRKVKDREVLSEQTNTYDGNGRRISRTEEGTRTEYYYAEGMLLYTTDGEGTRTSLNIAGTEDNVIAGIRYDDGEKAYFYGKDIKGSTTAITDSEGNVVVYYDYDDWGRTEVKGDRTFYNQICYTGAVYDSLTELYYMNARYYSPETGTFLSQDTYRGEAVEYGTWNLYAYCAGNPVSYVDPSGHAWYNKVVKGVKKAVNGVKKTVKKVAGTVKKAVKKVASTIKKTTGKMSGILCDALDIAVQVLDLTSDMAKKMSAISAVSALISSQLEGLVVSAGGEAIAYAGTAYLTMECAEILVVATMVGVGSKIVSNKIKKLKNNIKKKGKSGLNPPSECNISSKQFGKKWGKHKTDYPDLSMDEYKNLIDDVFKSPDKIIQDVENNEFLYLKGNNLLRVTNNGEFVSLYPGAESSRVLSAIKKGGTIWPK